MKKNDIKKKILPFSVILLLIISFVSSIGMSGSINPPPAFYDTSYTMIENGSWNISEMVRDGTADVTWNVSYNSSGSGTAWMINDTVWNLDEYPGYTFNYSIMWNNTTSAAGNSPFHWAIANFSYVNRSQSIMFTRAQNWSWSNQPYYGFIFQSNNSTGTPGGQVDNMTVVLYGAKSCFILHYNNTTGRLFDVFNNTEVIDNSTAGLTNYYNNWILNSSQSDYNYAGFYNGTWIKTIYNSLPHHGYLQSKFWGNTSSDITPGRLGLLDEPTGWVVETDLDCFSTNDAVLCGLAVWNPAGAQCAIQFDMINIWRLNYTRNHSVTWDVDSTYGRPHMNFPLLNSSNINNLMMKLFMDAISGNISMENITDFWLELTNNMSLESRQYYPDETAVPTTNFALQNDTIYYYSTLITNFNELADTWFFGDNPFTGNPDEVLWLWVQDCPQNGESSNTKFFVAIDTDNDGSYDAHDRAFIIDGSNPDVKGSWTGNVTDAVTNFAADIYRPRGVQNLHRYNSHNNYWMMIPRTELPKLNNDSGNYLNENDTFGLLILSENIDWDDNVSVWCNWNETNNSAYIAEDEATILDQYINNTLLDHSMSLGINSTNVGRWGEGQIGWSFDELRGSFALSVTKTANVTLIDTGLNTATQHLVNYSINITNTGTGDLTGIQINDTWFNCSCSNWNFTIVAFYNNSNATGSGWWNWTTFNVSWNNDSCYVLFNLSNVTLENGQYFNLLFVVDLRTCDNDTRGIITNYANVTCDQVGVTGSDTHDIRWAQSSSLRIRGQKNIVDVMTIASTVMNILGIILIVGAIMSIVGLLYVKMGGW